MSRIIDRHDLFDYILSEFPHQVLILKPFGADQNVERELNWLRDNHGFDALVEAEDKRWVHVDDRLWSFVYSRERDGIVYCFKHQRHAVHFKLKWGGSNACS